jgi:hypothetical protein
MKTSAPKENQAKICVICQRAYQEFGNEAWPVHSGRCCNLCNDNVVIPARIRAMRKQQEEEK